MKLSLYQPGNDPEETVELDDELVVRLREVVDASPDLTLAEALRQGVQHVVDKGPEKRATGLR
ncbi:MAG: hypothetical protein ABWY29_09800 [Blastococcus sp.]